MIPEQKIFKRWSLKLKCFIRWSLKLKCFKRWSLKLKMFQKVIPKAKNLSIAQDIFVQKWPFLLTHVLNVSKGDPWTFRVYLLDNFNSGITFWQFSQNWSFTPFCQQMTSEHRWSSHYQENDRLPERRGTYLSEFLIFTRTAKAHPLTKHYRCVLGFSSRQICHFVERYVRRVQNFSCYIYFFLHN